MTRSSAVRSELVQARANRSSATSLIAPRIPILASTFGITSYYDWREGYAGIGKTAAPDMFGGIDLAYLGGTAIGSVYTAGELSVDLEASSTDYFKSVSVNKYNSSTTFGAITIFAWVKKESNGTAGSIMARWRPSGTQRSWQIRFTSGNVLQFYMSSNGSTTALQCDSTGAITDTNWHFITLVNQQSTSLLKLYVDGVSVPFTFTVGSTAVSIFNASVETWVGALAQSTNLPTIPFDGKIGICGFSRATALDDSQVLQLYNDTRSIGGY